MEYNSSLIPEAYRRHIIKMLQMRGIEPTEENIMKVATAKPKEPKKPSDMELLATSLGSSVLQGAGSALGPKFGNWLGSSIFGNTPTAQPTTTSAGAGILSTIMGWLK